MACQDFIQNLITLTRQISDQRTAFRGTATRSDTHLSWYMEGWLGGVGDIKSGEFRLNGEATQYFSDRIAGNQPFDVNATDSVGVDIPPNGPLTLTLHNWGNAMISYTIDCSNGLLLATTNGTDSAGTSYTEILTLSIHTPIPINF